MKRLRYSLSKSCLALGVGLMALTFYSFFARNDAKQEHLNGLVRISFQSASTDSHSVFMRQSVDGEIEGSDESVRHEKRVCVLSGLLAQSLAVSRQTGLRQQRQAVLPGYNEHFRTRCCQLVI